MKIDFCRALVEMLLWENSRTENSIAKCVMILSSLSTDGKFAQNDFEYSEDSIGQALESVSVQIPIIYHKFSLHLQSVITMNVILIVCRIYGYIVIKNVKFQQRNIID